MDWMARVGIEGEARDKILAKAAAIIRRWGLQMPRVFEPLVLDFGLGDFSKHGHIEYWIANEEKQRYCGKFIFMFGGQTCPAHHHKQKHETFMIVKGRITMHLEDRDLGMNPGDVLPMPQTTVHSFTALEDSLILEVSLPSLRTDNFFKDRRIGVV